MGEVRFFELDEWVREGEKQPMATRTRATVGDVLRLGANGERYELVDGELVPMSPTNLEHGDTESEVDFVLKAYVRPRRLGKVFVGEPLFMLEGPDRLARAPDLAFVRLDRLRQQPDLTGAFHGAPDLAVEIVSPSNSADAVEQKVQEWLAHGTLAVLVMYPASRSIVLWRANGAVRLRGDDELDLDPAVPGFRCKVSDLFPPTLEELASEVDRTS
jgi:Uma2 family endonuclease